jgi:hypothetical protein
MAVFICVALVVSGDRMTVNDVSDVDLNISVFSSRVIRESRRPAFVHAAVQGILGVNLLVDFKQGTCHIAAPALFFFVTHTE